MPEETVLGYALQRAQEQKERIRHYQNERHRRKYKYLRDCGVPYDIANVAAFWSDERIEQLLNEIAK